MRIISLFPAATEMVCALGAASSLVGISHDSDYPTELLDSGIPRVTRTTLDERAAPAEIDRMVRVADTLGESLHVLDAQAIADLEPDVIITQGICDVCAIREGDVRIIAESLREPPIVLALSASAAGDAIADGVAHDGQAADAPVRHAANAAAKDISLRGLTPHAVPDAEALATAFQRALQRGDRDGVLALLSADVRISESGHTQSRSEYAAGHLGEDIAFHPKLHRLTALSRSARVWCSQSCVIAD